MAVTKQFETKKLDTTKNGGAVRLEGQYFELRKAEGFVVRSKYRRHSPGGQWGSGGNRSGASRQKKGNKPAVPVIPKIMLVQNGRHRMIDP